MFTSPGIFENLSGLTIRHGLMLSFTITCSASWASSTCCNRYFSSACYHHCVDRRNSLNNLIPFCRHLTTSIVNFLVSDQVNSQVHSYAAWSHIFARASFITVHHSQCSTMSIKFNCMVYYRVEGSYICILHILQPVHLLAIQK